MRTDYTFRLMIFVAAVGISAAWNSTTSALGVSGDNPPTKKRDSATEDPTSARKLPERISVAVDPAKFGEGWKQTIPLLAIPSDTYDVWVQHGWLHARRNSEKGALDWHIVLARVSGSEVPAISLIEGAPVFELSYANGRYFIRDTMYALRSVRQRKGAEHCLPRDAFFGESIERKGYGITRLPELMLSGWQDKEWFFVASGPDDERFDCVVRLNPLKKQSPGYGVQTVVGGYAYYFHGKRWAMDDGEFFVANRMLESTYHAELARERIRENLPGSLPPVIDATGWLNTDGNLSWDDLRGKVVLLDFWGTWCEPCVKKLPQVQQFAEKYADRGLVVIGVHSFQGGETCEDFVKERGISFPIAIDSGRTAERFAISAWPTYFLIDKTGKVIVGYTNNVPHQDVVENLLRN